MYKSSDIIKLDKMYSRSDLINISWKVTQFCNYKCDYCIQRKSWIDKPDVNQKQIEIIAQKIHDLIMRSKKNIRLSFIGGEATLFDLSKIIPILDNEYIKQYYLTTNLSRPVDYYLKLENLITETYNKRYSFVASLHETQCNVDDFFNKMLQLRYGYVSIVVTKDNYAEIIEITEKYKDKVKIVLVPEKNNNTKQKEVKILPSQVLEYMKEHNNVKNKITMIVTFKGNDIKFYNSFVGLYNDLDDKILDLRGYKCTPRGFRITPDGIIKRGICNYEDTKIEFIDNFTLNIESRICNSKTHCNLCGSPLVEKIQ